MLRFPSGTYRMDPLSIIAGVLFAIMNACTGAVKRDNALFNLHGRCTLCPVSLLDTPDLPDTRQT